MQIRHSKRNTYCKTFGWILSASLFKFRVLTELNDSKKNPCTSQKLFLYSLLIFCPGRETKSFERLKRAWKLTCKWAAFSGRGSTQRKKLREMCREFTKARKYKWLAQESHFTKIIIFPVNRFGTNIIAIQVLLKPLGGFLPPSQTCQKFDFSNLQLNRSYGDPCLESDVIS